jgi:hypothetical protein
MLILVRLLLSKPSLPRSLHAHIHIVLLETNQLRWLVVNVFEQCGGPWQVARRGHPTGVACLLYVGLS